MQQKMISLITQNAHRPMVLATVVATRGSTPRKAGAQMLVFGDGRQIGTIGGGVVEAYMSQQAQECLKNGVDSLCKASLGNEAAAAASMTCGGDMDVLLQVIRIV